MTHFESKANEIQSPEKIIDTHQHVFWHGKNDEDLVADMDEYGIGLAWLLTFEIPEYPRSAESTGYSKVLNPRRVRADGSHPGILLDDLLIARRNYPDRFLLGYCPDPAVPEACDLFEAACEMHDVRICGEWKFRMLFDDPRSLQLFQAAGRRQAPVVLHLDVPYLPPSGGKNVPQWYGGTVQNLVRALEACPETIFIGHAPGFWRELGAGADFEEATYPESTISGPGRLFELFDAFPNLNADLSAASALVALRRDKGFAREFLCRHAVRLLFARDYYGGDLLRFLRSLDLPGDVLKMILHDNAQRLVDPVASRPRCPVRPVA